MTGVQTCALPICFPVTIGELSKVKESKVKKEREEIHTYVCKEKKPSSDAEIFSSEKDSGNNDQLISEEEEKSKDKENTQSNNARENFSDEKDSGNNAQLISEEEKKEKKVAPKRESRFVPPTLEEVKDYEAQKGYTFSAEKFWGYYESNGWRVGKNPMKNWHGALRIVTGKAE